MTVRFKQCRDCEKEGIGPRPAADFNRKKGGKDGLEVLCKIHLGVQRRARQDLRREHFRAYWRANGSKRRLSFQYGGPVSQALAGWGVCAG